MKSMKFIKVFVLSLIATSTFANDKVSVFYVNLDDEIEITANPIKEFEQTIEPKGRLKLSIYPEVRFQMIQGVGGAFNEIGGVALMTLPKKEQREVMQALFGEDGANFSFCRTAIGSSDFGVDAYSYSEVAEDFDMKHFSVKREKKSVIPYIKMAYEINPDMTLFASPWSPPAWMKMSGYMDRGIETPELNRLRDDERVYKAYALYMAKYVERYAAEGIKIDRIAVQNETDISTKYPSNIMDADDMYDFVKNYLRPEFTNRGVKTEIWAGTFRTQGRYMHALQFASNPEYLDVVDGLGIQYTSVIDIADITRLCNGKALMHTESVCNNGQNTAAQGYARLSEVASYINSGMPNFCYWNMILDQTTKSGWDWAQNSLININTETGEVRYNPDFAVMSLFGRYLLPGSQRIASSAPETLFAVYRDGAAYLFVSNSSKGTKAYDIIVNGETISYATVPARSLSVIRYEL